MYIDRLRDHHVPLDLIYRSEADQTLSLIRNRAIGRSSKFTRGLRRVFDALCDPELDGLIKQSQATVGLIKPRAFESKNLGWNDDLSARMLLGIIGSERLVFEMPWRLTIPEAEAFYAPLRDKYLDRPQRYQAYGTRVWESVINHATSGPLTLMLICEDNAIEWWRERIGATYPAEADPASIRGKYAYQEMLPNNLVHGSDSPESAARELEVIRNSLAALI